MNRLHLTIRRLSVVVWTGFAALAILAGVVVGVGRLLLPFADRAEPRLEAWLSETFQRPVEIGSVGATWELTGPEFRLVNVRFYNNQSDHPGLTLAQAQVSIDLLAWLFGTRPPLEFHLADTELRVTRGPGGHISVNGLGTGPQASGTNRGLDWLLRQGQISLVDAKIHYTDRVRGWRFSFEDVDVTLDNSDGHNRIVAEVELAEAQSGRLQWRAMLESTGADRYTGRFYVQGNQLDLAAWTRNTLPADTNFNGRVSFKLWGAIDGNELQRALLKVSAADAAFIAPSIDYQLNRLNGWFEWDATPQGWRLSGEEISMARAGHRRPQTGFTLEFSNGALRFGSDYLYLKDLVALAPVIPGLSHGWTERLKQLNPAGTLQDVVLQWRPDKPFPQALSVRADLTNVGWKTYRQWPGVTGISGELAFDRGAGGLFLKAPEFSFNYPRLFRQVLQFEKVQGRIELVHTANGWLFQTPRLQASAYGATAASRIRVLFDGHGGRPFLMLHGEINNGQVDAAKAFWPVGIMPGELVAWLDRALVDGRLQHAEVMVYGDLDNWPFDHANGRFEARAQITDTTLDYHEEWPVARNANAELFFKGRSMWIESDTGTMLGAQLDQASAYIGNLESPLLTLDVEAHGAAGELLEFLRASPLNEEYGYYLSGLSANGEAQVQTGLQLPLEEEPGEEEVSGTITLNDVYLEDAKWDVRFDELNGRVAFDGQGFTAENLKVEFRGQPARLDLAVGNHTPDGLLAIASLKGRFAPSDLQGAYLTPLTKFATGSSLWNLNLLVPDDENGPVNQTGPVLTLKSNLIGTGINLPAPLGKPATESVRFSVELPLPYGGGVVALHYGERFAATLWPDAPQGVRGQVRFGAARADMPDESGVFVTGTIDYLNLDAWRRLMGAAVSGAPARDWIGQIDVQIDTLMAIGRPFSDTHIFAEATANAWHIVLDGDQVKGEVRLPANESAGLVGDFERLVLVPVEQDSNSIALNPRELPALHLVIEDFTFGEAQLGRTRLEAYPVPDGLRVDLLRAENNNLGVEADGVWTVNQSGVQRSAFDLTITATSLGEMLSNFGYAGVVENGSTVARLKVAWPGAPSSFALERVVGGMEVEVGAGRLIPVNPGAGRIFGLLSVQALPRRLALDFSDFFGEGLSFDAITGAFHFDDGIARTDNLMLKGPAARIEVDGQINLVAQTYHQLVTIYPSVGTTLPLVGALAAGAPGAAALFVIQGLFQDQLRSMASYSYRVTGPWADPVFELLETPPDSRSTLGSR